MRHRWFAGVASGLARFIGLDYFPVRMLIRFLFLALSPTLWWVYLLLAILLPRQKLYNDDFDYRQGREEIKDRYKDVKRTAKRMKDDAKGEYKDYKKEYKRVKQEYRNIRKPKSVYKPQVKVDIQRLEFDDIIETAEGKVSAQLYEKVKSIDEKVRTLMPQFNWWRTMRDSDLATVKRASLEWFPQAIQHYLSLPRDYAEHHILTTGATSEKDLLRQLSTLENTLNRVLESQYNNEKVQVPDDLKTLNDRFSSPEAASDDIGHVLDSLMNRIRGNVSSDIYEKVESIRESILSVLPQIVELGAGVTQESYNIRKTAQEYLPDALNKYMSLPEGFADSHDVGGGKTAKDVLLEQLDVLDQTMKNMVADVYKEDAQGLLIHGRFLKEKFADQEFELPQGSSQAQEDARIRFPDLSPVETKVEVKNEV